MGKAGAARKKEIEYLLKIEAEHEEKKKVSEFKVQNHPLINMVIGKTYTLCGRLSRNHAFYENKILENKGHISYTGNKAQVVVIPTNKSVKEMKKYKKFCSILENKPTIIKENQLCNILGIKYQIKDEYYTDSDSSSDNEVEVCNLQKEKEVMNVGDLLKVKDNQIIDKETNRCNGTTLKGKRCKNVTRYEYCHYHLKQEKELK